MYANAVTALSLAFQQSFRGVFDHAARLLEVRRAGTSPELSWPAWCGFPVGLAYDVLRCHYGYERDGVEPFLLAALAGWRRGKRLLRLDAEHFEAAFCLPDLPDLSETPLTSLYAQSWHCLYVEYPSGAGALGAFIFLDFNGEEEQHLVFLLHLEMYRVEPVLLPLTRNHATLGDVGADYLNCCARHRESDEQARFFRQAMAYCGVNLNVLREICRREAMAGSRVN